MAKSSNLEDEKIVFQKFTGINNVADASNLKLEELAEATNVNIDNEGRVSRRDGYTKQFTPSDKTHSLWSNDRMCFFIDGADLKRLHTDYSSAVIRSGVSRYPMEFIDVDENVYYSNASVNGYISSDGISNLHADSGVLHKSVPPTGQHIEYYNGRIYIAKNQTLWFTDPYAYSRVDMRMNAIQFKDEITMVKAVKDGLYVSIGDINERSSVVFLRGKEPNEFASVPVFDYGAIEGSPVKCKSAFVGDGNSEDEDVVIWTSRKGICIGANGGKARNLTVTKYEVPPNRYGAGLFRLRDGVPQYVASLWT
jgi:hypothetical protein